MAEKKRNVLEDIVEGVRRTLEDLDELINPEKRRKPVRIPVPVRVRPDERQYSPRDPYR